MEEDHTMRLISCIIFGIAALGIIVAGTKSDDPVLKSLTFVATVERKSYFADNAYMNWADAGNFCRSFGMRLGTVSTLNQFNTLENASAQVLKPSHYWTSARDSFLPRQFSWNDSQEAIPTNLRFETTLQNYQTCVVFYKRASNNSFLTNRLCNSNLTFVLCENVHPVDNKN